MAKHMVSIKEFNERLELYKGLRQPYRIEYQGNSRTIIVGNIKFYCYHARASYVANREQMLPASEISFISKVKKYITQNGLHESIEPNYKNLDEIKFIDYNKKIAIGSSFDDNQCVDINSAYWKSALSIGYLNDALYNEGLTKDKRVRLACLGTFAKTIDTLEFDGVTENFLDPIKPTHPQVFFNPANLIYKCMDECKNAVGKDFLFYWTDCVYIKNKNALKVCQDIISKHGFESKVDAVKKITFNDNHIGVFGKDSKGVLKDKKYGLIMG